MSDLLNIYISRLEKGDYSEFRRLDRSRSGIIDIDAFDKALLVSVADRLKFGMAFLEMSKFLLHNANGSNHFVYERNAISRSYYAIHHVSRAVVLSDRQFDPRGHDEAIEVIRDIVRENKSYRLKLGLLEGDHKSLYKQLRNMMEQRHHADYDVYGVSDIGEKPADFRSTADEVYQQAENFCQASKEYLKDKGVNI